MTPPHLASEFPPFPFPQVRSGQTQLPADMKPDVPSTSLVESAPKPTIDWGVDLTVGDSAVEIPATAPAIVWDFGADLGSAGLGVDSAEAAAPCSISWDIDLSSSGAGRGDPSDGAGPGERGSAPAAAAAIDWGIDLSGAGASSAAAIDIDWDISSLGGASGGLFSSTSAPGEEQGGHKGAAVATSGDEAGSSALEGCAAATVILRLERDADYRGRLLDDLQELRAFLVQVRGRIIPHP